jgi:hypothetical protein
LRASAGDVDRRRRGIVAGDRERRAVGQDALRRVDAQLAEGERGIVDGHGSEAPGMTEGRGKTLAQLVLGEAIMLLEVLGLQKHPLRPDHLVVPGHSDPSELWLPLRLHVGKSRGRSLVRAAPMRRIDRSSRRMAASHFT